MVRVVVPAILLVVIYQVGKAAVELVGTTLF